MADSAGKRSFSYVKHLREIRDRMGKEIEHMTVDEIGRWRRSQEYRDPMLRALMADAKPPSPNMARIRRSVLEGRRRVDALLASLVAEPSPPLYGTRLRVYVDTSVVGGCVDPEFQEFSRRLFHAFVRGEHTLVLSKLVLRELAGAPPRVRAVLSHVPVAHTESLEVTREVEQLANAYIEAGALARSMQSDAQHIALATLAEVDRLVSWNFKHIANPRRLAVCNSVNVVRGYPSIEVCTPEEIAYSD